MCGSRERSPAEAAPGPDREVLTSTPAGGALGQTGASRAPCPGQVSEGHVPAWAPLGQPGRQPELGGGVAVHWTSWRQLIGAGGRCSTQVECSGSPSWELLCTTNKVPPALGAALGLTPGASGGPTPPTTPSRIPPRPRSSQPRMCLQNFPNWPNNRLC